MADFSGITSDKLAPVYILHSAQPLLIQRAIKAITDAAVPENMRGFNLDVMQGKGGSGASIASAAQTLPMMAERRMVLVRDISAMPAAELKKLIPYIQAPSQSTVFVATALKLDKRIKFFSIAKKAGYLHELQAPRNVIGWVKTEAKQRRVALQGNAAARLADVVGKDLSRLALALEQLSLYAGDRPVSGNDVDDLIAETREQSVFELTDAIGDGDLKRALRGVAALCNQRQSAIGVVVMLARHMRQIGWCHVGKAEGVGKGQLARLVGAPPFAVERLMGQTHRYSANAVAIALEKLCAADSAFKGYGGTSKTLGRDLTERVLLERLVTEIVQLGS